MGLYTNMLGRFTERGDGCGPPGASQDRLVGDNQDGCSYHGHGIDVLLSEQRLEKQHCTLGKRESGWETAKCVLSG